MTTKTLKIAYKAMKSIKKAIREDRDHLVRLDAPVTICRLQETVYGHAVPDWHGRILDISDRVVTIVPPKPGEESCDGASYCPDKIDALGLDLAPSYLTHDAGTEEMDAIAEDPAWIAAGWTQPELRRLWDDLLGMMVRRQADALKGWKRLAGNGLARLMRSAVRALGGIMHGHLGAILAAALLAVAGCAVPPDDDVVEAWIWSPTDRIEYTVIPKGDAEATHENASDSATESSGLEVAGASSDVAGSVSSSSGSDAPSSGASSGSAPEGDSSPVLDFCFGGFRGGRAVEDSRCRISKLKIGSDSLSFKWDAGIPSDWQRGDTEKGPMIVACAFCFDGEKWIGGKFDWIDEHRTSRSLENIKGGYGGWLYASWQSATRRAFCVVSADGRHRSNLLED